VEPLRLPGDSEIVSCDHEPWGGTDPFSGGMGLLSHHFSTPTLHRTLFVDQSLTPLLPIPPRFASVAPRHAFAHKNTTLSLPLHPHPHFGQNAMGWYDFPVFFSLTAALLKTNKASPANETIFPCTSYLARSDLKRNLNRATSNVLKTGNTDRTVDREFEEEEKRFKK